MDWPLSSFFEMQSLAMFEIKRFHFKSRATRPLNLVALLNVSLLIGKPLMIKCTRVEMQSNRVGA